ncbi:MAG: hypothetical protein M1825_006165 [Sarcosagium campestre]|nr:MAG: hypothetical protein M1825_006165 [Sarcosagium campestre]
MPAAPTGAKLIAQALHDLKVEVIFGIVGIPVVEIAEEAINLGIRFIGFRNEQAASYAATAYGYITGRPGVCLVVGGPGVLHAMAGIGNSSVNAFPLLLLAGSSETHLVAKGAFQELDAISLLTPHTKLAVRPPTLDSIPQVIENAYRVSWYGRPGTGFVDLPADLIQASLGTSEQLTPARLVEEPPRQGGPIEKIRTIAGLFKRAKAPLIVIGKGAAFAQADDVIRDLIESTGIPFLPTPMGKGVVPDSHPLNAASARSAALAGADVVLILGARLNWILHFGEPPKWNPAAQLIQVDISPEEIGRNGGSASLGLIGDIKTVTRQLHAELVHWKWDPSSSATFSQRLSASKAKNESTAAQAAISTASPMTYARAFAAIKSTLHRLSPPSENGIVYVSEGANTMDISRAIFPVNSGRHRLDAGTHATMGVGLGYAIAAHAAYNPPLNPKTANTTPPPPPPPPPSRHKKIVALEGDSAFGFSGLEVETLSRARMDVLIFVINNSGVYHGDATDAADWTARQRAPPGSANALRSTSLGYEVRYELLADMCGGKGFFVRTPDELERATEEGFHADVPVVVNVVVEKGKGGKLEFAWQGSSSSSSNKTKSDDKSSRL